MLDVRRHLTPRPMTFILYKDFPGDPGDDLAEFNARHDRYREYLVANRARFPSSAYSFATADWRFDPTDHRCPHDSWVETLTLFEPSSGEYREKRGLEIHIRLLGAYHDGYLNLVYSGVRSYSLDTPSDFALPPNGVGHGDWLVDEIRLSDHGHVLHEIEFSRGSRWVIECRDIMYRWEELVASPMPPN